MTILIMHSQWEAYMVLVRNGDPDTLKQAE